MRIVAGAYRGRSIVAPKGHSTRPTGDRARQALFNIIEHAAFGRRLTGARVLDLFAGSGALGLEALSRGATFCLFVDHDRAAREAMSANLLNLGCADRSEIQASDAAALPPRGSRAPFDLAFLDPPYGEGLVAPALEVMLVRDWLAAGALVSVEQGEAEPPLSAPGFATLDVRRWGAARITILGQAQGVFR